MKNLSLRITVALVTLLVGVTLSGLLSRLRQPSKPPQEHTPCPTPTPPPPPQCVAVPYDDDAEFPENSELDPWEISNFIDAHPQAKLKSLWKRLHVKPKENFYVSDFAKCGVCSTKTDQYDLDNEPGNEMLLKISDEVQESFRYLIFKYNDAHNQWRLLGHVDEWGKYKDSESLVLASGGRSWLVIQGQSASGSGVAFYHNRVFSVSKNGLNEIAAFESDGFQSGTDEWPSKEYSTRILSCEATSIGTKLVVEYNIDYCQGTPTGKELPLFSKRQKAVLVKPVRGVAYIDQTESEISQREMEHIYLIDSMTDTDFLRYNYSELVELGKHGSHAQRNWLKSYLKQYATNSERQQKLAALVK